MIEFTLHHTIETAAKDAVQKVGRDDPELLAMVKLYVEEAVQEWVQANTVPLPEEADESMDARLVRMIVLIGRTDPKPSDLLQAVTIGTGMIRTVSKIMGRIAESGSAL